MDKQTRRLLYRRELHCVELLLLGRDVEAAASHSGVPVAVALDYAVTVDWLATLRPELLAGVEQRRRRAALARLIVGPSPHEIDVRAAAIRRHWKNREQSHAA